MNNRLYCTFTTVDAYEKVANTLNELIKSLNNEILDKKFPIEWNNYRNCILLVQTEGFNKIDTKVKEIINL